MVYIENIPAEFFKHLGTQGMKFMLDLCNSIYKTGTLPKEFLTSIFIPIPKKAGATDCKQFRTISLITHACKILLNIVHNRLKDTIDRNLSDDQNGFRKGRGTRESIFALRVLGERAVEMQNAL